MTKIKSTKRALLASGLALLMCVSMLIGSTFAWFTDSVTSSGNIIKSGTLDVEMYWAKGNEDPNADATAWTDASTGAIFNNDKWEPGYTEVRHIKIANEGTLALKYQLNIIANGAVSKLADVIDVYYVDPAIQVADRAALTEDKKLGTLTEVLANISTTASGNLKAGEKDTITLALKMQESAGNEYQDLAIGSDFSIQLLATQLTSESDSFDNQYDMDADYDGEISNATSLAAALKNGGTYKVLNDIAVDGESFEVPAGKEVALDIGGKMISGKNATSDGAVIVNNGTLTLTNGTISSETVNGAEAIVNNGTMTLKNVTVNGAPMATTGYPAYAVGTSGKLTIEEGTKVYADRGALRTSNGAELVINGGEFIVSNAADGRNMMNHVVYAYGANTTVTINDGYFEYNHTSTGGASVICPYYATIIVNGGDFRDVMDDSNWQSVGNFQNYMGTKAPVVYGGTYDDKTHTKWLADGYVSIDNGDGTYTVIKGTAASNQTALDTAIESGESTVVLGSGEYVIPDSAMGKTLTIIGNGSTTVAVQDDGGAEGDIDYSFRGSNVTFENVTLKIKGSSYPGYAGLSAVYNNCTIVGSNYALYGDSVFNNCTFNLNNGYVWTWGAANVEFNGCTFEDTVGGKAKAILVHNTVETVVTVKDCTFKATASASTWDGIHVAAVSIDPENGSPDATVHFEGTNTCSDAFYGLYQVKYADEVDDVTITVDGTEVAVTAMK